MQTSPRVTLPFNSDSPCEETTDERHVVEYRAARKEVWCIYCDAELTWNENVGYLLHAATNGMEDLQYKDDL